MANLLVTGGAGFIGANFVHYWLRRYPDDRLVVLDALTYAGNLASLAPVSDREQYRFVRGDICDEDRVTELLRDEAIDTVVHFAAESHVDRSISGPAAFIETNIIGTHNLLQAARKVWLDSDDAPARHRFHHVGQGQWRDQSRRADSTRPRFHPIRCGTREFLPGGHRALRTLGRRTA